VSSSAPKLSRGGPARGLRRLSRSLGPIFLAKIWEFGTNIFMSSGNVLNLRNFPRKLRNSLRKDAREHQTTLTNWCVGLLGLTPSFAESRKILEVAENAQVPERAPKRMHISEVADWDEVGSIPAGGMNA
jgi:hypothetical protein